MRQASLSQRLSAVFAVLLLACCGASAWLQTRSSERHEQEVIQRLSGSLAAHIAANSALMEKSGLNPGAVRDLFDKLMAVNPSVEVYLLDTDGRITGQAAPAGHLKRDRVDVAPIRRLLAGEPMPIVGDDPRSDGARKVFSAAPLSVDDRDVGYVYVVLQGEEHDALAVRLGTGNVLGTTLWSMALVAVLGLVAGLAAFRLITRPLRTLTAAVRGFDTGNVESTEGLRSSVPPRRRSGGDEIATLEQAFWQMASRIDDQWRELTAQDQQRRELVANISHDLRTPLTSLHGYLETLLVKADTLTDAERRRYLEIALGQSRKVGRLAQELFELARLEYGVVKPEAERFSLAELVQDVFQKFELAAEARQQRLVANIAADLPAVTADLGMIERVLTNLLDNAIRHTPPGGEIEVRLRHVAGEVVVQVSDTGPGIPAPLRERLFTRPSFPTSERRDGTDDASGGLGLAIVQRILQLHGSDIRLMEEADKGAVFRFQLSTTAGFAAR
jgi:signal transduction histidine kinase